MRSWLVYMVTSFVLIDIHTYLMTWTPCIFSMVRIFSFSYPACLNVSGVDNYPWVEGLYTTDSSLQDCYNATSLRYRQIGGLDIWSYSTYPGTGNWRGTTTVCEFDYTGLFYSKASTASRPDLVATGTWLMKGWTVGTYDNHQALTVVIGNLCGKSYQWQL